MILRERGLDAVSMRNVADRLGVSPMPLYTRVGNKAALIDAVADHLLDRPGSRRRRRRAVARVRGALVPGAAAVGSSSPPTAACTSGAARDAYVEASRPLIAAMRDGGLSADASVQACRLLMWATVGFVAMEQGSSLHDARRAARPPLGEQSRRASPRRRPTSCSSSTMGLITAGVARMHDGEPRDD